MECNQKAAELYLIEILHQTTTVYLSIFPLQGCILSKFYIKPQHLRILIGLVDVVSYRNSTSNHNNFTAFFFVNKLYLIEILHQTTTTRTVILFLLRCILSKFYIKPQPLRGTVRCPVCCILSKFYIKPQRYKDGEFSTRVVSYRNSTSNHNTHVQKFNAVKVVSYRNSTSNHNPHLATQKFHGVVSYRNSTSNHNVRGLYLNSGRVVSYRNSTSNHNANAAGDMAYRLYLIEILHQTTTLAMSFHNIWGCILSKFYIKPQPSLAIFGVRPSCILSKFYIKPQPMDDKECLRNVVSYRNSTSNHNGGATTGAPKGVVSYRNSTSNHNGGAGGATTGAVVSYRNSTSNHNL